MVPKQGQQPNVPVVPPGPPPSAAPEAGMSPSDMLFGAQQNQIGQEQALAQATTMPGPTEAEMMSPEEQELVAAALGNPRVLMGIIEGAQALMAEAQAAEQGAMSQNAAQLMPTMGQQAAAPAPGGMDPAVANAMLFGGAA